MPVITLSSEAIKTLPVPPKGKTDFVDTTVTGFLCEVRSSGGMTYYLKFRSKHGRLKQFKIGDAKSLSFEKAKAAAQKLRARVVLGQDITEERKASRTIPTIAELYRDTYLPHVQSYRRNMESDLSFWKVHLLPKFGDRHLDELATQEIVDAQMAMRKDGYAPGTCNKWVAQTRYMYAVAAKFQVPGSEKNPAAGIKQFHVEGRERFLSPEETERLREAVEKSENTQLKYVVALLLMLGCRKMELLKARFEDFDLERRTWRIPLSKSGKPRHITLSTASVAVLKSLPRWEGCPWVVPNPRTRKPFTGIQESWDTARRRAGLDDLRMHDLRHSFASNLVNAGQSLFVVSKALGHSSTRMSERYAHLADDTLLAAADAAANAISKGWTGVGEKTPA